VDLRCNREKNVRRRTTYDFVIDGTFGGQPQDSSAIARENGKDSSSSRR
jgi:hypothetical protein